jgi:hypothetical protein
MFKYKKLLKLQIRPPSLFLLITHPSIGESFPSEAEKWENQQQQQQQQQQ